MLLDWLLHKLILLLSTTNLDLTSSVPLPSPSSEAHGVQITIRIVTLVMDVLRKVLLVKLLPLPDICNWET
jgi:hypothetical protein